MSDRGSRLTPGVTEQSCGALHLGKVMSAAACPGRQPACARAAHHDDACQHGPQAPAEHEEDGHGADGLQRGARAAVAADVAEHERAHRVQLHAQQAGQLGRRVAVEELDALHEQRAEQLHAQAGQHLRGRGGVGLR